MFDRRRIAHERQQHAETDDGDAEADDEHHVEALRQRRQNHQADQRAEHRTRAVERAMDAEGDTAIGAVAAERDQRVARRGPNALAESIERDDAGNERPGGAGQRHADSADGGDAVAGRRDFLVPPPPVRGKSARDAEQSGGSLVETVDQAELQRRHPELHDEIDGQHRRDHFRRDVGEQARESEGDHVGRDGPAGGARRFAPEAAERGPGFDLIHRGKRGRPRS